MAGNVIAISEAVSLGFHGMALLAASKKRLSARDMAKALSVSEAHLTKIFQRLARHGLVRSVRGPGGGFELGQSPDKISLLSIYHIIEGAPEPGQHFCSCCENCIFENCIFDDILQESARQFLDYLSRTTLDSALLRSRETPDE